MTTESVALVFILCGMAVLIVLAIGSVLLALDGRKHRNWERRHGTQDTDEVPVRKVHLALAKAHDRDGWCCPVGVKAWPAPCPRHDADSP